ncbi:hypothetical protein KY308_02505 [Candidatus Woesearchaeota archaeon]|nr:hypothetical protein [Candidatus Woesearchaeota archaeon]
MEDLDKVIGNVGDITGDYAHKQRITLPFGLVTSPNLVMKMYAMFKEGPTRIVDVANFAQDSKNFLLSEIRKGRVEPLTGMGFVILSEDMLNVARWDAEHPHVLKNQVYCFTNLDNKINDAELHLDLQNLGSFCIWELGIVNFEKEAWKEYLGSSRTKGDKLRYLNRQLEGRPF